MMGSKTNFSKVKVIDFGMSTSIIKGKPLF